MIVNLPIVSDNINAAKKIDASKAAAGVGNCRPIGGVQKQSPHHEG
jgi:hypothetical protein